jgi:hypothetical protein
MLHKLGLSPDNSIVIGSGILEALGIRKSKDIDIVVNQKAYDSLRKSGQFNVTENHGREILTDDKFEIGTSWTVLGKSYKFEDFVEKSIIVNGVRYITINFLYKAKKSWICRKNARQKDIEDVKLIEAYPSKVMRNRKI